MNILSIDWDYFIDADASFKECYFPDGGNENLHPMVQNMIWEGRYAQSIIEGKDIRDIKIRREYDVLYEYLKQEKFYINEIAESHKNCYYFVSLTYKALVAKEPISITNVDFHSDLYETGNEVNCGNWLSRLKGEGMVDNITWVGCPDSLMDTDVPYARHEQDKEVEFTTDLVSQLEKGKYSAVFICRSGVWSPPHLDGALFKLCDVIDKGNTTVEEWRRGARWNRVKTGIKQRVEVLKDMISLCNQKNQERRGSKWK